MKLVLEQSFIQHTGGDVDLAPTLDCVDNPDIGENAGPITVTIKSVNGVDNAHLSWFAPAFTYQWLRDGAIIRGATKNTYMLTGTDRGHRISVRVTATKAGYTSAARTSSVTTSVTL